MSGLGFLIEIPIVEGSSAAKFRHLGKASENSLLTGCCGSSRAEIGARRQRPISLG